MKVYNSVSIRNGTTTSYPKLGFALAVVSLTYNLFKILDYCSRKLRSG